MTKDYKVGRGKPPEHSRFKKGRSGNSKGRPKGSKNLATTLDEVLQGTITVTIDGRKMKVPTVKALLMKAVAKGLGGDINAILKMLDLYAKSAGAAPPVDTGMPDEDEAVLAAWEAKHRRRANDNAGGGGE